MRKRTLTSSASALLLFGASLVSAGHGVHEHLHNLHKRHRDLRTLARSTAEDGENGVELRSVPESTTEAGLEKRTGSCAFPYDAGLVAVTPGSMNAGWAMSPDQPCKPGGYCPYACPPGQVMMQWDPRATSYSYPQSMNGGLFCDDSGNVQKPFPDKPYCQSTQSNIGVQNNAGGVVSFCQTVLPGNEAMLIPTPVYDYASLAVPDPSYWCGTAAHYYINPPGIGPNEACIWGTSANPVGNWSPYVAGANTDASGQTFIKLGWNPIYLEPTTPFRNERPNWGVKIECPGGGCNGLPCAIDPAENEVNQMVGSKSDGAGGGAFCVVTVPKGVQANFVIFSSGGGQSNSWSSSSNHDGRFYETSSSAAPTTTDTTTTDAQTSTSEATTSTVTTTGTGYGYGMKNQTNSGTGYSRESTQSPYYSLFHTGPVPTTAPPTEVADAPTQTAVAAATGGASSLGFSVAGLASGVLLSALAFL